MKNLLFILFMLQLPASLAATQDHQLLRQTVAQFVQQQTAALPGKASYSIEEIDPRLALPHCDHLETFLPSGSQLIGKTSIGLRCSRPATWSIFVPVQIKISMDLLISTRQLPAGHVLQDEDVSSQLMEVTQVGGLSDGKIAIGKVLRYSISAGQVLREDMLRPPFSVQQGQTVQLIIQGEGFKIRSSGVALNNASEGQIARARNDAGHLVSGIAQPNGVINIAP